LDDARALLNAGRYDGAGYHAGYVIECALKTLLLIGNRPVRGHDLSALSQHAIKLATDGSPQTARYIPNPPPRLAYDTPPQGWQETMRYRAPGDLTGSIAQSWLAESERIYRATVAAMRKDGVIQ
jgi:uncharacterized protein RhaS with RHS repeats